MYEVIFLKSAEQQLSNLTKNVQEEIIRALERIKIRPYAFVRRLVGSRYFRLRVGAYRVILDIQETSLIIVVVELGHRRDIYK